jgi:hypothetical protein
MAGTIVPGATNYNGTLEEYFYMSMYDGMEFLNPGFGAAYQKTGVRKKTQLDKMIYTQNPLENYTEGNPGFGSGATKSKRDIEPKKMTLSGTFTPDEWLGEWDRYAPNGNLTSLMMNPAFLRRVVELALNASWDQIERLFWQGDYSLYGAGTSPLRFFDGIITRLIADTETDVTFVTPQGVISEGNADAIIKSVYQAIPNRFKRDPNYKMHVSHEDFDILQFRDIDVKKSTDGILEQKIRKFYLGKEIVPYNGMKKDHIIGAHSNTSQDSNLVFGTYFGLDAEFNSIQVAKIENLGVKYGFRVDFMADTQYRSGRDISLYKPT